MKYNKIQTIGLASSFFTMFSTKGYSCTMVSGSEEGFHTIELTIFWNTNEELNEIIDYCKETLRDGDTFESCERNGFHWTSLNFNYK